MTQQGSGPEGLPPAYGFGEDFWDGEETEGAGVAGASTVAPVGPSAPAGPPTHAGPPTQAPVPVPSPTPSRPADPGPAPSAPADPPDFGSFAPPVLTPIPIAPLAPVPPPAQGSPQVWSHTSVSFTVTTSGTKPGPKKLMWLGPVLLLLFLAGMAVLVYAITPDDAPDRSLDAPAADWVGVSDVVDGSIGSPWLT